MKRSIRVLTAVVGIFGYTSLAANDIRYFDPHGKEITRDQYNRLLQDRGTDQRRQGRHSEKAFLPNRGKYFHGSSWHDDKGESTTDPRFLDSKGRPVYNEDGNYITY